MLVLGWVVRIVLLLLVLRLVIRFVAGIVQGYSGIEVGRGGSGASRVSRGGAVHLVKDPVCGTYVVPAKALTSHAAGVTHHFCSEACRDTFERSRRASRTA
jgi:YHS domain-containing protein